MMYHRINPETGYCVNCGAWMESLLRGALG